MRKAVIALLVCLGILFYLGTYATPSGSAVDLEAFRPARFLRTVGQGARLLLAKARGLGQGLFDRVGDPQRERVDRHFPSQAFPR